MTSPKTDDMKGRVKEAAGALTDDDNLKREGKRDQAAAGVKKAVEKVGDKIQDGVDAVKDRVHKN